MRIKALRPRHSDTDVVLILRTAGDLCQAQIVIDRLRIALDQLGLRWRSLVIRPNAMKRDRDGKPHSRGRRITVTLTAGNPNGYDLNAVRKHLGELEWN